MGASRYVERLLHRLGFRVVAGIDEVGMGPLAGPVVAAAVVLPSSGRVPAVADSKTLTARARERLAGQIRRSALGIGVGVVEPADVDRLNVYRAGLEAMTRALGQLVDVRPDFLVLDGRTLDGVQAPQAAFPQADAFVSCVAAASIVAKVERDAIMAGLDHVYPAYGFASHMGYCTPAHLAALETHGPSPVHRRSFAPVARWREATRFRPSAFETDEPSYNAARAAGRGVDEVR
jgi:ribonuclease HII